MYLCDDGHDEVCYDVKDCPVCVKMSEIVELEDKIFGLKDDIKNLKEDEYWTLRLVWERATERKPLGR